VGIAGEGGNLSSGGLLNKGASLVWVVLMDTFSETRPFLCLVLDCNDFGYVGRSRDKEKVTYSFLVISPVFVK
jgi:hypothetical protein